MHFYFSSALNPISLKHRTAFAQHSSPVCSVLVSLLSFPTASLIFSGFLSWLHKLWEAKANEIPQPFCALQEASFWIVTGACKGLYSFDYLCPLKSVAVSFYFFQMKISEKFKQSIGKTLFILSSVLTDSLCKICSLPWGKNIYATLFLFNYFLGCA